MQAKAKNRKRVSRWATALGVLAVGWAPAWAGDAIRFSVLVVDSQPRRGAELDGPALDVLAKAVADRPRERATRFELVRGLRDAGRIEDAIAAAREWRSHDAYNLVAVRMLGDLLARSGERAQARRVYSAVAELLPDDASAQRALATVLKQSGDLASAHVSLGQCVRLAPDDKRLAFELADLLARLGRTEEAETSLQALASDSSVPDALLVPVRQRLAQILARRRHVALAAGDGDAAAALGATIRDLGLPGAAENDIRVFLTWDTDRSDVDLWVTSPQGERVYYGHKKGLRGEALYHDVTNGYGPETFVVPAASRGSYLVQVNYYSGGGGRFPEARGEVTVVIDEGRPGERREVFPYEIEKPGLKVDVARIEVR